LKLCRKKYHYKTCCVKMITRGAEKMKIKRVKERSIVFTHKTFDGWDLNLHLINGEKYNYVIDTGLGSFNIEPIKEYINTDRPTIVINTHYHWDHIWGNGSLEDCIIISHRLCRDMIEAEWDNMMKKNMKYCLGEAKKKLPDLVFEGELYFPEDKIRLIYTPGHTIDSISVIDEEEKVANLGDNIGDTLEEIVPNIYTNKELYINTLLQYQELDFDTCISGHNIVLKRAVIDWILKAI